MLPQASASPQDWRKVSRHVEAEQGREPEDCCDCDGSEKELCVVEKGKGVVAEESDDEVVVEGEEVYRV
jgi:hypothetical protein